MRLAHVQTGTGKHAQRITVGAHHLVADEPREAGGDDTGPAPHEFLLMALGACTSMTVKMYADRKGWPLRSVDVVVTGEHDDAKVFVMRRTITFDGDLDAEQRRRLLDIADKCPVHKTLSGTIRIETSLE